jgi:hypothetical protein
MFNEKILYEINQGPKLFPLKNRRVRQHSPENPNYFFV